MSATLTMSDFNEHSFLAHHGILGMKWGIRRYQNKDGSLTPAGKRRYARNDIKVGKSIYSHWRSDNPDKYKEYLKSSKITEQIKSSATVQERVKKIKEHLDNIYTDSASDTELAVAQQKAEKEAKKLLEKELGRKLDPNNKYDNRFIEQLAFDEGLYDKYEKQVQTKSEREWNKKFDQLYNEYRDTLYKEIDATVGRMGKIKFDGSTYRDLLTYSISDLILYKH